MIYSKLLGTGGYLPEKIVTNDDIAARLDTSHEWIFQRTGICQRHVSNSDESVAMMATSAAKQAIDSANLSPNDIDLIVVATCTGEMVFPSAAGSVQKNLNIPECPAFDLSAACAGFTYALAFADSFVKTGKSKNALVIGSEVMSKVVDDSDRSIAVLFGDGAGAVVLGASEEPGIIATDICANGNYDEILRLGQLFPTDLPSSDITPYYVHMEGRDVFKIAVEKLENMVDKILVNNGFTKSDLSWLVPHQANYRIIKAVARRLDLSEEQVVLTVGKHANTSAASIPLALNHGIKSGDIKRNDLLLLESFGGGLAWGSALIRY